MIVYFKENVKIKKPYLHTVFSDYFSVAISFMIWSISFSDSSVLTSVQESVTLTLDQLVLTETFPEEVLTFTSGIFQD